LENNWIIIIFKIFRENKIIKDNEYNQINIIILKIIWLESNSNYIESILKAFELSKDIINDKDGIELNRIIFDLIYDKVDKERNPEFAKEANKWFYIIIRWNMPKYNWENIKFLEITIKDYSDRLKEISNILLLQTLNHDLFIYLNELYIINELIKVI
jgi:hypothetical protein